MGDGFLHSRPWRVSSPGEDAHVVVLLELTLDFAFARVSGHQGVSACRGECKSDRKVRGVAMTTAFFSRGSVRFLKALEADNTKDFFDAHRGDYEREILTPLRELVAIAEPRYGQ